jgi:ADP-ribose pyrophosphatase YjhB (NUDIX family)
MNADRGYRKSTIPPDAKRVFEGKIFDVYHWEQKLYDGSTMTFERIARPDTVVVFPVLADGTIMLIEDTQPDREMVLTAPSGRMEKGEKPEETALRELKEETGYAPESLVPFYTYAPYKKIDWMVHVFIAQKCSKVAEPNLDAGEKIVPHPVSFDELVELATEGKYHNDEFDTLVLRAKLDPKKMGELRKKFLG